MARYPGLARPALILMLGLGGCDLFDTAQSDTPSDDMTGWRYVSGKTPSQAEYTAIVAACQDGAVARSAAKPLDACLADLGLKRAP